MTFSEDNNLLYSIAHFPNNCGEQNIYTYYIKTHNNTIIDEKIMSATIGFTLPYLQSTVVNANHEILSILIFIFVAICALIYITFLKDRRNKPLDDHLIN
jgi:hypothetical protein